MKQASPWSTESYHHRVLSDIEKKYPEKYLYEIFMDDTFLSTVCNVLNFDDNIEFADELMNAEQERKLTLHYLCTTWFLHFVLAYFLFSYSV